MRVWIDLDNSPHVPFFAPIVRELRRRGHSVRITARQYAQTLPLAQLLQVPVEPVGTYGGGGRFRKVGNLVQRAWQLYRAVRHFAPELALSHGSRAQVVAAALLRIPAVVCLDYEWTERWIFRLGARWVIVPECVVPAALEAGLPRARLWSYPGLKEEVYLPEFVPQPNFRQELGIGEEVLVVLRPPSLTANYRRSQSLELFEAVLRRLREEPSVVGLLLPRSREDREWSLQICHRERIENVRCTEHVVPGLQLLYWADVVISGGGTMNREAALLGTPTYSVFAGRLGAVDQWLWQTGRLHLVRTREDIERIPFVRHRREATWRYPDRGLAGRIVSFLEEWRSSHSRSKASRGTAT